MCTWNKRHHGLFSKRSEKQPVIPAMPKEAIQNDPKAEKSSVERQLDFLHHLHI